MDGNGLFYKAEIKKIPGSRIAGYCCTNDTLPTGNLDSASSREILGILKEIHRSGRTVILITHDNGIAAQAKRVVRIMDGKIESDTINENFENGLPKEQELHFVPD